MDIKYKIIHELRLSLEKNLEQAKSSFESSKKMSRDSDYKQESKYDTRAIELGQLALGQQKRIEELEQDLALLDSIVIDSFEEISIGSLVKLEYNEKAQWYFISTVGGGTQLSIESKNILVLSVFSPLGDVILGGLKGEEVELESPKGIREYTILDIL